MPREVSVIIPSYNEEASLAGVISEVQQALRDSAGPFEIIVVDDGSKDDTVGSALGTGARVLQHRSNRGYGAALKTGIAAAKYEVIAILDGDSTYPVTPLPGMLAELDHADMVVGARIGDNVNIPLIRRPAKWVLGMLANYVTGTRIPDLNSGLRVFRREAALQYFTILPDQFSFTTTITMAMHCDKYAVSYLPIDYRERKGNSKIVPWDAMTFAILILRLAILFRPLRVALPLVVMCLVYGLAKMSIDLARDPNISASALLAFMTALQILLVGMLGDSIATRMGRLRTDGVDDIRRSAVEVTQAPAGTRQEDDGA